MPLYLIGMPGAGKSTLGQVLSPMLGLTFIDSDAMAEERMGMSINQAVQQHGLAHFRNIESQLLVELVQMPATLVATGGGFPLLPGAMRLMNDTGLTVWLNVPVGELATRILAQPQLRNHLPKATTLQLEESLQNAV